MPTTEQPSEQELCSQMETISIGSDSDYSSSTSSLSEIESSPCSTPEKDSRELCASELVRYCLPKSSTLSYSLDDSQRRGDCPAPSTTTRRSDTPANARGVPRTLVPLMTGAEAQLAVSVATWRLLSERQRSKMSSRLISRWMSEADRDVRAMGWQSETILSVSHLVILHGLLRRIIAPHPESLNRTEDVRSLVLVCLYIVCSYAGQEISYPYRPFASTTDSLFWARCIPTACAVSSELLQLTTNKVHFDEEYTHLRQAGLEAVRWSQASRTKTANQKNSWMRVRQFMSGGSSQLPC